MNKLLFLLALPIFGQVPELVLRPTAPIVQAAQPKTFTFSYPGTFYGGAILNIGDSNNSQPNSCLFRYGTDNTLSLLDDAAGTWSASLPIGVPGTLNNSQCSIDAGASSVLLGNDGYNPTTTTAVAVTFSKPGNYSTFAQVLGFGGRRPITPWQQMGTVMVVPSSPPVPIVVDASEEAVFLQTLNTYRAQNGSGPIRLSSELAASSKWMSDDLAAKNYFSHTDSLGRDAGTRIAAFGYQTSNAWWGENIAAGQAGGNATFTQWLNACDPDGSGSCTYAHRVNMLNPNFNLIGIGRTYNAGSSYGWYWVTDFGRN